MANSARTTPETTRTPRRLRPRATAAISIAPATVTDLTCAIVLGLEPRQFREWLVRANVPHSRIGQGENGQRVIARVADCLAAITPSSDSARDPAADPESATVDAVLARLGRRRTA